MLRTTLFVFFFFPFAVKGYSQSTKAVYADPAFIAQILQQHQTYRDSLKLPALSWSPELAKDALAWAQHLAKINKGEHDRRIRGKEGENLWWGTAGAFSYSEMVAMWANERQSFKYDSYPNCTTDPSAVVGHYTQMVWKNTQFVGCAMASNGKTDFLVCRYSPPGNIVGEKPY
jgi:uncharacterized protein YkwD